MRGGEGLPSRAVPALAPPAPLPSPGLFRRLLAVVRRASAAIYRTLVLALLAVVYVLVLPFFALAFRLRARRAPSAPVWRLRDDPGVASMDRLRSLF